jgi:hypothetical protein
VELYTLMYVCSWKECCDKSLTQQSNLFLIPRSVNIVNQKSTKTMTIPPASCNSSFFSFLLHLSKFKLYTEFLRNSVNKKKNRNKEINTHNKILKRSTKKEVLLLLLAHAQSRLHRFGNGEFSSSVVFCVSTWVST